MVRKMAVGPSAPPMMPMEAASGPVKPRQIAPKKATNTPSWAAAPSSRLFGSAISGTKVGHRADAHEDEGRIQTGLDADVEDVQQTGVLLDVLIANQHIAVVNRDTGLAMVRRVGDDLIDRLIHNARQRQVRQQHAERNRHQQQRLKLLDNRQIEQHERDQNHHRALPVALDNVVNTGIVDQAHDGAADAEVGHHLLHRTASALRFLIHIHGDELIGIADQRHIAVADFGGFRLHGGSGLLGANGQRRKHAAQRQSEDHTQNFFHSA